LLPQGALISFTVCDAYHYFAGYKVGHAENNLVVAYFLGHPAISWVSVLAEHVILSQ